MARKRSVIPAFPVQSRLLVRALLVAAVALLLAGYLTDENGLLLVGGLSLAGALLVMLTDWLLGGVEDEE